MSAADRIDCPTCGRMGRVTVILPNGTLSTATCPDCHGEGWRYDCADPGCRYCAHVNARMMPATPLCDAPAWGGF